MDFRQAGSAMRRRFGAPSSHLGAAGNPGQAATAAGGRNPMSRITGKYSTGTGSVGEDSSIINNDPREFVSEVSAVQQNEPNIPRGRLGPDSLGARLTVSPSMKMPDNSPVPTQAMGRIVQSRPGRSTSTFFKGASEELGA